MATPQILWHTYPLGLLGADQTGRDRTAHRSLAELVDWLPHVRSLGADTILLGPIFSSLSHGYDTVTHREVDDRLGTTQDLDLLISAAGAQGIGIVLDGAFAYVSRAFWRLRDPDEQHDPWLQRTDGGELVPWRGVESLVTPDFDAIGYQDHVVDVLSAWLDRGVIGWRLDSAWTVPAPFWRKVLSRVRQVHPQAWFLGQVFDDDLPPITNRATYSSTTEYALMHGVRAWLSGGPVDEIAATLRVHEANGTRTPVHTFLGNHDDARLADVVDPGLLPAAYAVLMTLPGLPSIYYGDELATSSSWPVSGDDAALRPSMSPGDPAAATGPAAELLRTIRRLGAFRRARGWLAHASVTDGRAHDGALAYRCHRPDLDASLTVWVNPSTTTVRLTGRPAEHVILGSAVSAQPSVLELPPHGWAIVEPR